MKKKKELREGIQKKNKNNKIQILTYKKILGLEGTLESICSRETDEICPGSQNLWWSQNRIWVS